MSVPEEIRRKLETYAFGHGGQFDIGPAKDRVCVAVKFHPHTFSLAWMFAEEIFRKSGIEVDLRPSLLDRIVEPDTDQVAELFYGEVKRFAQKHGGRFIFARNDDSKQVPRHRSMFTAISLTSSLRSTGSRR